MVDGNDKGDATMKNALEIEAMAAKMTRDEAAAVELALHAMIAAGCDMTRVHIEHVDEGLGWPSFPGIDIHDAHGVAARVRWRRCVDSRLRFHLSMELRASLRRPRMPRDFT